MRAWILSLLEAAQQCENSQEVIAVQLASWTGAEKDSGPFEMTKNEHFSLSLHDAAKIGC